jgi:hypothetical protein
LLRGEREDARRRDAQRIGRRAHLPVDFRQDLRLGLARIAQRVDLVQRDEARLLEPVDRADVLVPERLVVRGKAGIRAHHEDDRRRIGNAVQRELGLGRERGASRRVEHREPLARSGCGRFSDRVAPARHSTRRDRRRSKPEARGVAPESVIVSVSDWHARQRCGSFGSSAISRQLADSAMSSRSAFGLSRVPIGSSRIARRARGIPEDLDRAERRAAHAEGSRRLPELGEEERVDELALAARILGDEGDGEALDGERGARGARGAPWSGRR